ncbi:MAG TPA: class I SAM-dependent methyltransferase [Haliangiales bacterium]|nr:class I SAM-dependent methyltransferase [Haliangiales bacterium]
MSWPTKDGFHSRAARKDTFHTLSLVEPRLRPDDTVLDVGCGSGYVAWQLAQRHRGRVLAVDIVDCRKVPTPHFALYDGIHLPFEEASCDVVMLSFLLHHVPNDTKPGAVADVRRVVRRVAIVLEDTPRNFIDRYFNRRHGEKFRRSIGSSAPYGFYTQREWETFFAAHGFAVAQSGRIGRFARDVEQPFARSWFVLAKK